MTNRQWKPPVDEVYGATESPNGELGFYVVADGTRHGLPGADAAAVVHPLRDVSVPDRRATSSATWWRCWAA